MLNKKKLCSIALVSTAVFLMLVSSAGAAPCAYVSNYGDGTVSVIDTATNTVTATVNIGGLPIGVSVNPVGKMVYVTNWENVSVIDTATNTVTATVNVGSLPLGIAVTPDGKKVYVGNYASNNVSVIDSATNTVTTTIKVGNNPNGISVTPDGKKVYVANSLDNSVSIIDTATNTVTATVNVGEPSYLIAITPDGKKAFVTNSGNSTVSVIDTATNTVASKMNLGHDHGGVAVSPDGKKVYVTNQYSNDVFVIDTATNAVTATVNVEGFPQGVAVTPDGTKVYVVNSASNNVSVIDTATNTVTTTIKVGNWPIASGHFIGTLPTQTVLPVVNFSSNVTQGYAPLSVQFADLSRNTTAWNWDFENDGRVDSTSRNPVHTYTVPGQYIVNLTAINADGTASKFASISVFNPADTVLPEANFSTNTMQGPAPLSVQFTDSSENATVWNWDFGDGTTSIEQNPAHTYSVAGNYTVNLTVSNGKGASSKTLIIIVDVAKVFPLANFTANTTIGYAPLSVQFTDLSQNLTYRIWDFGDGTNSTEQNPLHIYSAAGNYAANLTVTNENGTDSKLVILTALQVISSNSENSGSSGGGSSGGGSSGSSGGGGAGGSPEPQSNVEVKELSQTFVTSGNSIKFEFPRNATPLVYISFDSKKTAGKITTIAEVLKGKSTLVTGQPSDEVYKYINIWVGNSGFATSNNIENAVISFKIEKSWIQDKKIVKSSITLNRYSDKKWTQFPAALSGEDDKYLYFTAKTPGFSPFAITGKSTATAIQPAAENKTQLTVNNTQNSTVNKKSNLEQTSEKDTSTPTKESKSTPGFEIVTGITGLLIAILYKRK